MLFNMTKPSALYTLGAIAVVVLQCSHLTAAFQVVGLVEPRGNSASHARHVSTRSAEGATALNVYMISENENLDEGSIVRGMFLRDRLRQATGFSLTACRAAGRAATGISFTAIYGTAVAVSGLWIRKTTSVVLAIFPAWFRYFLQPILIAYYLPIFIIRGLTGPTRKQAQAKHKAVKESWKDAIEFAKQAETGGYWPVLVNGDGDFELVSPPRPSLSNREDLAEALLESVEMARDQGYNNDKSKST